MVKRVKTIYMELGLWAWGCGSWLQAVEAAVGRTIVMQMADLTLVVQCLKFLRRNPTVLFPLAATFSAWFPDKRSSVTVTPRYLLELTTTSCCPWRW